MGNNIMTPENFSLDFGFVAVDGKESIRFSSGGLKSTDREKRDVNSSHVLCA